MGFDEKICSVVRSQTLLIKHDALRSRFRNFALLSGTKEVDIMITLVKSK